jgi:hypothetical protein
MQTVGHGKRLRIPGPFPTNRPLVRVKRKPGLGPGLIGSNFPDQPRRLAPGALGHRISVEPKGSLLSSAACQRPDHFLPRGPHDFKLALDYTRRESSPSFFSACSVKRHGAGVDGQSRPPMLSSGTNTSGSGSPSRNLAKFGW